MRFHLVFFVCLLASCALTAQVQYGVKGGLNLATVEYINTENSRARLGWNAGLLVEVPVQEKIFVRPELQYSSKGFGFNATQTSREGSVRLNYITVPLLVGYSAARNFDLLVGPELGFLRKAVSKSQGITNDMTNFYRKFDIGIDVGASYNVNKFWGLDFRYNHGFKGLVNIAYYNSDGSIRAFGKNGANRVFQLGLFYRLSE